MKPRFHRILVLTHQQSLFRESEGNFVAFCLWLICLNFSALNCSRNADNKEVKDILVSVHRGLFDAHFCFYSAPKENDQRLNDQNWEWKLQFGSLGFHFPNIIDIFVHKTLRNNRNIHTFLSFPFLDLRPILLPVVYLFQKVQFMTNLKCVSVKCGRKHPEKPLTGTFLLWGHSSDQVKCTVSVFYWCRCPPREPHCCSLC